MAVTAVSWELYEMFEAFLKEKDELIAEWTPEPLVPDTPPDHHALHPRVITSKVGKTMVVDGRSCLNLASHNYLSLAEESQAQEASLAGLRKYGVGSCGPRGFFGTVDIHLELESRLAEFMDVEEACLYSYGFSTMSSAIPSYAKQGDIIFVWSKEIDLMCATLENAIGSFGGFCCGTSFVVDHQRLSGLGYCFSASLPPLQASVSMWAIDHLTNHPEILVTLRRNCLLMHEKLKGVPQLRLGGDDVSAIKHLYVAGERPRDVCDRLLDQLVQKAWEEGVVLTRSRYLEPPEHLTREPSIRIAVCAALTEQDIDHACSVIGRAAQAIL
ncbi:serine palmitoyltransferase I, putative [Ixodes scapularis]|uniref:Serine palmitoyltransferase 1 n=1 Tax=Ixodes scapularis TaxID=6945 RepID=B7PEL4_IXOSC|nr:serine palmitoyltransferase I, putative [Ixodes scapularis]|eukprot:XP_002433636.1 serine palmitoyltransferase I, putative [Ixodes scapularis]